MQIVKYVGTACTEKFAWITIELLAGPYKATVFQTSKLNPGLSNEHIETCWNTNDVSNDSAWAGHEQLLYKCVNRISKRKDTIREVSWLESDWLWEPIQDNKTSR